MTETAREWLHKAEKDYRSAKREMEGEPNHDLVCFLSQQCVEKLMKGLLAQHRQVAPRTHDLLALGEMLKAVLSDWEPSASDLSFLSRGAVQFRYPGEDAAPDDAVEALDICDRLRDALLPRFMGS